jgi:predicted DNA-binding transcriptional regulator YafY
MVPLQRNTMLDRQIAQSLLCLSPSAFAALGAPTRLETVAFDRIERMLLGLAIGDSLGNTTEGQLPEMRHPIRDYQPNRYACSIGRALSYSRGCIIERALPDIVAELRHAILPARGSRLHYRARSTGALSRTLVCPYGFLYGNRHYLLADSLDPVARGFRLFSLANIEKVETTTRSFTRRKSFSLQKICGALIWRVSGRAV